LSNDVKREESGIEFIDFRVALEICSNFLDYLANIGGQVADDGDIKDH